MSKFEVTDAMVDAANDVFVKLYFTGNKTMNDAMRAAITAAIEASGILEENARLRADVARLENLQEFWHGCVVLARKQLEETSQRLGKWIKERPTNDQ